MSQPQVITKATIKTHQESPIRSKKSPNKLNAAALRAVARIPKKPPQTAIETEVKDSDKPGYKRKKLKLFKSAAEVAAQKLQSQEHFRNVFLHQATVGLDQNSATTPDTSFRASPLHDHSKSLKPKLKLNPGYSFVFSKQTPAKSDFMNHLYPPIQSHGQQRLPELDLVFTRNEWDTNLAENIPTNTGFFSRIRKINHADRSKGDLNTLAQTDGQQETRNSSNSPKRLIHLRDRVSGLPKTQLKVSALEFILNEQKSKQNRKFAGTLHRSLQQAADCAHPQDDKDLIPQSPRAIVKHTDRTVNSRGGNSLLDEMVEKDSRFRSKPDRGSKHSLITIDPIENISSGHFHESKTVDKTRYRVGGPGLKSYLKRKIEQQGVAAEDAILIAKREFTMAPRYVNPIHQATFAASQPNKLSSDRQDLPQLTVSSFLLVNKKKSPRVNVESQDAETEESDDSLNSQVMAERYSNSVDKKMQVQIRNLDSMGLDSEFLGSTQPTAKYLESLHIVEKIIAASHLSQEELARVVENALADVQSLISSSPLIWAKSKLKNKPLLVLSIIELWFQFMNNQTSQGPGIERQHQSSLVDSSTQLASIDHANTSRVVLNLFWFVRTELTRGSLSKSDVITKFLEILHAIVTNILEQKLTSAAALHSSFLVNLQDLCSEFVNLVQDSCRLPLSVSLEPSQAQIIARGFVKHLSVLFQEISHFKPSDWSLVLKTFGYLSEDYCEILLTIFSTSRNRDFTELSELMPSEFDNLFEQVKLLLSHAADSARFMVTDNTSRFVSDLWQISLICWQYSSLEWIQANKESLVSCSGYYATFLNIAAESKNEYTLTGINHLKRGLEKMTNLIQEAAMFQLDKSISLEPNIAQAFFLTLFDLIDKRYGNDNEQRPILDLIGVWTNTLSCYIIYSSRIHSKTPLDPKKARCYLHGMQDCMFRIKRRKTYSGNSKLLEELFILMLALTKKLELSVQPPAKTEKKKKGLA